MKGQKHLSIYSLRITTKVKEISCINQSNRVYRKEKCLTFDYPKMIYAFPPYTLLFLAISQFFCLCNLVFITKCIFATGQLKTYILVKSFIEKKGLCILCPILNFLHKDYEIQSFFM